jgi:hypothetical protein
LKLLFGLSALMLAVGIASLVLWRLARSSEPAPCWTRELDASAAPGGGASAEVFEVHCPGAVTTHVALRAAGRPAESRADVFVGMGAVLVHAEWNGDRELSIESPGTRPLVEETRWREVRVRVRR